MPNDSFYKLDVNKRKKILEAMKREFSRVPFHEASVTKIVEDAGISKGSFWVYFQSKEEAIEYLVESHLEDERRKFRDILEKNHGDLFEGYIEIYDYLKKTKPNESDRKLLVNIFSVLITNSEKCIKQNNDKDLAKQLKEVICMEKLKLINEDDLLIIIKLLNFSMRSNLSDSFIGKITSEKARQNFIRTVEILRESLEIGGRNVKN